jgi:hypothetical protein
VDPVNHTALEHRGASVNKITDMAMCRRENRMGGIMPRWGLLLAIMLHLPAPSDGFAQFLPHVDGGSQRGAQDDLVQEQLELQNVEQRRHIREEEFQAEVRQWTATVQTWRELTGQPPLSQDEIRRRLDQLRAFDWERQYQEAWTNK